MIGNSALKFPALACKTYELQSLNSQGTLGEEVKIGMCGRIMGITYAISRAAKNNYLTSNETTEWTVETARLVTQLWEDKGFIEQLCQFYSKDCCFLTLSKNQGSDPLTRLELKFTTKLRLFVKLHIKYDLFL